MSADDRKVVATVQAFVEIFSMLGIPPEELTYKALLEVAAFLRKQNNFSEYTPHVLELPEVVGSVQLGPMPTEREPIRNKIGF